MPSSSLDPDNIFENDRQLGKGHNIDSLGPSDVSDTGSDAIGAYTDLDPVTATSGGFDRVTTTDQPYDPVLQVDFPQDAGIDPNLDAELAFDPTMGLDLSAIADDSKEIDDDELLDEEMLPGHDDDNADRKNMASNDKKA